MKSVNFFNIDLNLLLTLAVLLQTRSVSATARRLGTSQPTASRALGRLRDLFKDPLLIRTNVGMELTRRGEDLVEPLQQWLTHTNSLFIDHAFDPATVERRYRIAATDFGVTSVISPALSRLNESAPGATLEIMPFANDMPRRLASGEVDLILSGLDPDQSIAYSRRLFSLPGACIMRAEHPLAQIVQEQITLDQFLDWPHISILIDESGDDRIGQMLGRRAAERKVLATTPYCQTAQAMIAGSDALAILPCPLAQQLANDARIVARRAPEGLAPMDYWVLWHERSRRDPATIWLIDLLCECSGELAG